jgi:hypothetical protein
MDLYDTGMLICFLYTIIENAVFCSVLKRQHTKFRRWGITKIYNIYDMAKFEIKHRNSFI